MKKADLRRIIITTLDNCSDEDIEQRLSRFKIESKNLLEVEIDKENNTNVAIENGEKEIIIELKIKTKKDVSDK